MEDMSVLEKALNSADDQVITAWSFSTDPTEN